MNIMNFRKASLLTVAVLILIYLSSCSKITSSDDSVNTGGTAPGFTLESVDGSQVKLEDFSGKVVLLFFFGDG